MRTNSFITDLWATGGPFVGDNKPHGRVTVQLPWADLAGDHKYDVVRKTYSTGTGNFAERGLPLRWYQDLANDQVELEVPNIKQIHTTRSIDSDAATFDIVMSNQQMHRNTETPVSTDAELGQPGYFSFGRGVSLDAQARWGQVKNAWENLLVPNALLRTYQGYGGNELSIDDALAAGNIMLTGIWFVDHVEIHTDGTIHLTGRDGAKMLLDQQLYLPLVPRDQYPLTYYRWQLFNVAVKASARTETTVTPGTVVAPGAKRTEYETSSVDAWYGYNFNLHGHVGTESVDGNPDTYALGEGNSRPDAAFATSYWQYVVGEAMNSVYIYPWAGNFTAYISVMENGVWQGTQIVPYDPSELYGTQVVVDTGANIPYVAAFGIPWETPGEYILPRPYQADRVRVTLRDLTYTEFGPWHYRGGLREVQVRASDSNNVLTPGHTEVNITQPMFIAADSHPTSGYVTCDLFLEVDAFGDARIQPKAASPDEGNGPLWGLRVTHTGLGYYLMSSYGRVTCYGDAVYHGDPQADGFTTAVDRNCADMAITPSGNGYWVLDQTGRIWSYGDAAVYTAVTPSNGGSGQTFAHSIESHPTNMGVWVMDANGKVFVRGTLSSYGDMTPLLDRPKGTRLDVAVKLRADSAGTGYWMMTTAGAVSAQGTAVVQGHPIAEVPFDPWYAKEYWGLLPHADDSGYLVMRGDGFIFDFGASEATWDYGSPIPGGMIQQRKDGNYKDYVDIIRDLALWSGFLLYDPAVLPNAQPAVYGNLESTGAFSPEALPTGMFDKKPVIDAMHALKEVVGYLLWVDDEGALRFESPNWWAPGNFDEFGDHTTAAWQIDEAVTLINYGITITDEPLRSLIIISSDNPDPDVVGGTALNTITARLIPTSAKQLRGLVKPAMWVNGFFMNPAEQDLMAELIALHTYFQSRVGQTTCVANPCMQINDQARIWERQTSETYLHYIRGIDTTMDLEAGSYTMTVTHHWLGDETNWAIQSAGSLVASDDPDDPRLVWAISPQLQTALEKTMGSKAAKTYGHNLHPIITSIAPGSQTGTGAAHG